MRHCSWMMIAGALLCASVSEAGAQTFNSAWDAASGQFPDELCDWVLNDTAIPEMPSLNAGVLTLSTDPIAETMFYTESGSQLNITYPLVIEARLRVVSESHVAGNPRLGVAFNVTVAPDQQNVLLFGVDEVFLWSSFGVQGPTALVDTDDAFHVYRMEVSAAGAIEVFQNGNSILNGSIITHPAMLDIPTISWGDVTGNGLATSEWTYFRHTANADPCGVVPAQPKRWGALKSIFDR